jgi:hypothetical protein
MFKNFTPFTWLYMAGAFISFVFSVTLWFLVDDAEMEAVFVGLWVPSILALGSALEALRK